jgi:hypothetical protein
MIDPVIAWLARLALAGVFAAAALHKWRDLGAFTAAVAAHRLVPESAAGAPRACATAGGRGLLAQRAALPAPPRLCSLLPARSRSPRARPRETTRFWRAAAAVGPVAAPRWRRRRSRRAQPVRALRS